MSDTLKNHIKRHLETFLTKEQSEEITGIVFDLCELHKLGMGTTGLSFGQAIYALQRGKKVCREGWNGKGMFLAIVESWNFTNGTCDNYEYAPFIAMKTAQDKVVPWLASQTDILAEDWMIVD